MTVVFSFYRHMATVLDVLTDVLGKKNSDLLSKWKSQGQMMQEHIVCCEDAL